MKALLIKELKSVFCSSVGAFFAFSFLVAMGTMLWAFGGRYNITDGGYASMNNFFELAPILLSVLIPALTMRLIAEERRSKTLDILFTRPIKKSSIFFSKFLASLFFVFIVILPTIIYVYSLSLLANPMGNIDMPPIGASYFSLILLAGVFIAIGIFCSATTPNQVTALILSIAICLFSLYGFELLAHLFASGKTQALVASFGLSYHCKLLQLGVVQLKDILVLINYILIFSVSSIILISPVKAKSDVIKIVFTLTFSIIVVVAPNIRFDFTTDKRYTLNHYSKTMLTQLGKDGKPIKVNIYLSGDLNAGFIKLQNVTKDLLSDLNRYSDNNISVLEINPYKLYESSSDMQTEMEQMGMDGIILNEVDREGKASKKIIYPYAQVICGEDSLIVPLLKNIKGYTAEENLNLSAENLEFEFVDAIRLLTQHKELNIAFIEGHGEIPQVYVYDAEIALSKYYMVNRGQISNEIGVLDHFDAIIVAGPTSKFSEADKYIIDQYIMNGGKVIWLVDGTYYSSQSLHTEGISPTMKNDVNLDDLLFTYGVRINADLMQDSQCASIYVLNDSQTSSLIPCFFMPILMPSADNIITRNIQDVKTSFASSISIVNNTNNVDKKILLTSSANSHLIKIPEPIDLEIEAIQQDPNYFNEPFVPVAVSLEGEFDSAFANRIMPDSIIAQNHTGIAKSKKTKMVIAASSQLIRNEFDRQGNNLIPLPMGYDRVSGIQYGNRDFIVNAINWLTDDEGWMELRKRQQRIYLINKKEASETKTKYAVLNIGFPILFVGLVMSITFMYRKRKYEK